MQLNITLSDENKNNNQTFDLEQYTGKISQDSAENRIENENYAQGIDFSQQLYGDASP